MKQKRWTRGSKNFPKGKKTGLTWWGAENKWVLSVDPNTTWLLRNFLTPLEKRALVREYRNRIDEILKIGHDEDRRLTPEEEHSIASIGSRIKFIVDHF